jgi:hypothetical protein
VTKHRHRVNDVVISELFALLMWVPIVVASLIWDANWPTKLWSDDPRIFDWVSLALFFLVSNFVLSKSGLMTVRTWSWGRLGASLIVANFAFGVVYEMGAAYRLWPLLSTNRWVRLAVLVFVLCCVLWAKLELMRTSDQDAVDDGYAELVEENALLRAACAANGIVVE